MKFSSSPVLALSLALLSTSVSAQTVTATTPPSSSLFSRLSADVASYASSAFGALPVSQAAIIEGFLETADGGVATQTRAVSWSDYISSLNAAVTGTPSYLSDAPSEVVGFVKSLATAEASIINKDTSAANALGDRVGVKVVGLVVAGVAAGIAFVL